MRTPPEARGFTKGPRGPFRMRSGAKHPVAKRRGGGQEPGVNPATPTNLSGPNLARGLNPNKCK